ncbi:hypothetical protein B484DRAFT_436395, partial [Ochromonadaceae sp. CCMP2298]
MVSLLLRGRFHGGGHRGRKLQASFSDAGHALAYVNVSSPSSPKLREEAATAATRAQVVSYLEDVEAQLQAERTQHSATVQQLGTDHAAAVAALQAERAERAELTAAFRQQTDLAAAAAAEVRALRAQNTHLQAENTLGTGHAATVLQLRAENAQVTALLAAQQRDYAAGVAARQVLERLS